MQYIMPKRRDNSNKGDFGKILNFSGSENYIGAAYLSSAATLKIGAGLTAIATTKNVINSISNALPEAIYYTRSKGFENFNKFSVILIGCGLDTTKDSIKTLKKTLKNINPEKQNLVIDADGLNILSNINTKLPNNSIITPHPLEASRLLGIPLEHVMENLIGAAKNLTEKYSCTTVLKTHHTIICNKNLEIHINNNENSALAKAGTGDVLAGIISGLLAQKMQPFEACKLGVHLHAVAGTIAAKKLTKYSVLASDILEYLPIAIKKYI